MVAEQYAALGKHCCRPDFPGIGPVHIEICFDAVSNVERNGPRPVVIEVIITLVFLQIDLIAVEIPDFRGDVFRFYRVGQHLVIKIAIAWVV